MPRKKTQNLKPVKPDYIGLVVDLIVNAEEIISQLKSVEVSDHEIKRHLHGLIDSAIRKTEKPQITIASFDGEEEIPF